MKTKTKEGAQATISGLKKHNPSWKVGAKIKTWEGAKGHYLIASINEKSPGFLECKVIYTYKNQNHENTKIKKVLLLGKTSR